MDCVELQASLKERRFVTAVYLVGDFKSPLLEALRFVFA
jgi:hypothetical protein